MNKSRLQVLNFKVFIVICCVYLATIISQGIFKSDFSPVFIAFCTAVSPAIVSLNIRYAARETALSKSSPSVVEKIITKGR